MAPNGASNARQTTNSDHRRRRYTNAVLLRICYELGFATKKDLRGCFRKSLQYSGERGIRTLGTLTGTPVFKTGAPPMVQTLVA